MTGKEELEKKYSDIEKEKDNSRFYDAGRKRALDSFRSMDEIAHEYGSVYGADAELEYRAGYAAGIDQFAILYPQNFSKKEILDEVNRTFNK